MLYRDKRWFPPSKFNIVWGGDGGYILVSKGDFKARYAKKRGMSQHFWRSLSECENLVYWENKTLRDSDLNIKYAN